MLHSVDFNHLYRIDRVFCRVHVPENENSIRRNYCGRSMPRRMKIKLCLFASLFCLGLALPGYFTSAGAQTAFIPDAWWTFQQDCNGDGCKAGTLPGQMARLNWDPDVTNCNGTLIVYEKVYSKP